MDQLVLIILSSLITGTITAILSAVATVRALTVHIDYLREGVSEAKKTGQRAHERIDKLSNGTGVNV